MRSADSQLRLLNSRIKTTENIDLKNMVSSADESLDWSTVDD